ncbi:MULTISPECIES: glycosyltransferase [unclassified Thalassospira]|uniref:glycosyltransferase family 2 protein n=1 Tax=unclassified Thalassospira TaxID=2648997 RepID=UPI001B2A6928|nr:glycosyltransferase [Thalassospira sp.]MBO6770603.1 glycosyltransferase [Thalassospira sp.]
MLEFASSDAVRTTGEAPGVCLLNPDTLLLSWDTPTRLWEVPKLETIDGAAISPQATLRLPLDGGGTRLLRVIRRPVDEPVTILAEAGTLGRKDEITIDPDGDFEFASASTLLNGVTPAGRLSLVSTLLGMWASLFRLRLSKSYNNFLRQLVAAIVDRPKPAKAVAKLSDEKILLATALPDAFNDIEAVFIVAPSGFRRLTQLPHISRTGPRGQKIAYMIADRASTETGAYLVVTGMRTLAVRHLPDASGLPSLARWWQKQGKSDADLREYIIGTLARADMKSSKAAIEFQLRCPLSSQRVSGGGSLPSGEVDLAVTTARGTLIGGWYRDPVDMIASIDLLDSNGIAHPFGDGFYRYHGNVQDDDRTVPATGFVGFYQGIQSPVPILQPRSLMRLKSGNRHLMVPPAQPIDPAEARARILRAVPPQHLTADIIENCLAPVIGDLQQKLMGSVKVDRVIEIGTPHDDPDVSIIVPLYRVLGFLRAQVGAFACDDWVARYCELVFVLDSPEQAEECEHLLRGLHILYGIPMRLVVMTRNGGYARACNAGAEQAHGHFLAMLNSDVIPHTPGWAQGMAAKLGGADEVAVVGPKLLFEDGSIQHAGMYFARNESGKWLNYHYHKGMPDQFKDANIERSVPGVTGACMMIHSDAFEAVGGFTEDYVIGDYEDSDLCLKIRKADFDIKYVPDVSLYHFERKSISTHVDYMRGVAAEYNAWLHAARWGDALEDIHTNGVPQYRSQKTTDGEAA